MGGVLEACIERRHGRKPASSSSELVLGNDDLLREVLLRLPLPTSLVRAACVCKRWLRVASAPSFLRDFRALHPPPLLGSFPDDPTWHPKLLPRRGLPAGELTAMARRTNAYLSTISQDERGRYEVLDVRNGRVLFYVTDISDPIRLGTMVCSPLMQRSPPAYLPFEWLGRSSGGADDDPDVVDLIDTFEFLPEDGGDGLSYYEVTLAKHRRRGSRGGNTNAVFATVVACRAGIAGERRATPPLVLPKRLRRSSCSKRGLLCGGGKFYVVSKDGYVLGLDLAAMTLFCVCLPDELLLQVQDDGRTTEAGENDDDDLRNVCLSRGEGSEFYVVCIKGFEVFVWLLRDAERGSNASDWELVDTICLLQVFAEHDLSSGGCRIHLLEQSGDHAEFVYLSVVEITTGDCSRTGYYLLHVKSRAVEKVFEVEDQDSHRRRSCLLKPFMMVWPPAFPALNDGHAWS